MPRIEEDQESSGARLRSKDDLWTGGTGQRGVGAAEEPVSCSSYQQAGISDYPFQIPLSLFKHLGEQKRGP